MSASSRTSSLEPRFLASATCLPSAPASLKESKKPRSLSDTSSPAPVTPFCNDSHSCSVKSAFLAMIPLRIEVAKPRQPPQIRPLCNPQRTTSDEARERLRRLRTLPAREGEHRVQLDRVRRDAALALVEVEEDDPAARGEADEPRGGVGQRLHRPLFDAAGTGSCRAGRERGVGRGGGPRGSRGDQDEHAERSEEREPNDTWHATSVRPGRDGSATADTSL